LIPFDWIARLLAALLLALAPAPVVVGVVGRQAAPAPVVHVAAPVVSAPASSARTSGWTVTITRAYCSPFHCFAAGDRVVVLQAAPVPVNGQLAYTTIDDVIPAAVAVRS
jgi:hypothetical protein